MATNAFYCPYCYGTTRHVSISVREMIAAEGKNEIMQIAAGINDLTGFNSIASALSGRRMWKCCGCGACSMRSASGRILRITEGK